jgi:DNA-damage-inducible protein J
MATADTVVRARINGRIKNEASVVLAAMGLTVSDAFRLLLTRVAQDKNLPFTPLVPNKKTIAALEASRRGEGKSFKSVKAMMADLNADD